MAAYETTDDVMKFFHFCNKVSNEYGFGKLGHKRLGGSSDAAYVTMAKTPILCSFGVKGQWNHTIKEYALVDSLLEITKLISTIIMNINKFE